MPTVKLRFPGGRYHATPWGHHVNEGLIEWPPCPWRLLRALIARGFATQRWSEIPPIARQLIDKLAPVLPLYRLPTASAAHSRHFMPYIEGKAQKTTLVFDTWANIGDNEVLIHWPCELTAEELDQLETLVATLGYLGRSESWVEAQLVADVPVQWNAMPCLDRERRGPGWEQISLIAAIPPREYSSWRQQQVDSALEPHPLPEGKKKPTAALLKAQKKAVAPFPADLLSCLTQDTAAWKAHGWSQPPGSRRVLYWRPSDSLQVGVPRSLRPPSPHRIESILLAITTPSGNRSALPQVTRTLPQAELLHRAIVSRAAKGGRVNCPELTGKDEFGEPLRENHSHAHTVPLALHAKDDHLDHILIFAKMGLGDAAQRAIHTLRRTWTKGGVGDLQIAVVGSGNLDSLRQLPTPFNREINSILGPDGGSRCWESVTPFVPPRTPDRRGKRRIESQIQAELASRCLPEAESVEIDLNLTNSLRHFVRRRNHGGVPPRVDVGYGLRIRFAKPVPGPLLLGYGSHYGLGLFRTSRHD